MHAPQRKNMMMPLRRALLLFFCAAIWAAKGEEFQPQPVVTIVESKPRRSSSGSLSMPDASPWCDSKPTIWVVGNKETEETPVCQNRKTGAWEVPSTPQLVPPSRLINCCHLDANSDGKQDAVCLGEDGKNVLYLTQKDGSLQEVKNSGLANFGSQTECVTLEVDGAPAVFITVDANDEMEMGHRMFKLIKKSLFEEVDGPWTDKTGASCVVVADVNNDDLDDIFICRRRASGKMFIQCSDGNDCDGNFQEVDLPKAKNLRSIRIADVNDDGYPDLLTLNYSKKSILRVFKGMENYPFFNFKRRTILYYHILGFAANDLAVLDANNDGRPDIYVALIDEMKRGGYCKPKFRTRKWWGAGLDPPDDFVPPSDEAHDILFLASDEEFERFDMEHEQPGCGYYVENFGDNLLLVQGTPLQPGPTLLLQWNRPEVPITTTTTTASGGPGRYQPKITTIESQPARKNWASMSMAEGSPWCDGEPTVWFTGHQPDNEAPWCKNPKTGEWEIQLKAALDDEDELNGKSMDRHACCHLDVDFDGLDDVACFLGAGRGTGEAWNEFYLTQKDGSLKKVIRGHGLHKYPTLRPRYCAVLEVAGTPAVFIGVRGQPREDGRENEHRMFKVVEARKKKDPYFEEVAEDTGPWIKNTKAACLHVFDLNLDGLDDICMCNEGVEGSIFIQKRNGSFQEVDMGKSSHAREWRNLRAADMDGDGIPDLLVVQTGDTTNLRIFKGRGEHPFFDFTDDGIIYEQYFEYGAPDIEVVDINRDGLNDVYVMLTDSSVDGSYCGRKWSNGDWWDKGTQPKPDWIPPLERTHDYVLLGKDKSGKRFEQVEMLHEEPGCGYMLQKFGDNGMLLSQGTHGRPGHTMLLEWPRESD